MQAIGLALALSNLVLATVTFSLFARPELPLNLLAKWAGADLFDGSVDAAQRDRLVALTSPLKLAALTLLFCWSFLTGAVLGLARL